MTSDLYDRLNDIQTALDAQKYTKVSSLCASLLLKGELDATTEQTLQTLHLKALLLSRQFTKANHKVMDDDSKVDLFYRAYLKYAAGAYEDAVKMLENEEGVKESSSEKMVHLYAQCLYQLGDRSRALELYRDMMDNSDTGGNNDEVLANYLAAFSLPHNVYLEQDLDNSCLKSITEDEDHLAHRNSIIAFNKVGYSKAVPKITLTKKQQKQQTSVIKHNLMVMKSHSIEQQDTSALKAHAFDFIKNTNLSYDDVVLNDSDLRIMKLNIAVAYYNLKKYDQVASTIKDLKERNDIIFLRAQVLDCMQNGTSLDKLKEKYSFIADFVTELELIDLVQKGSGTLDSQNVASIMSEYATLPGALATVSSTTTSNTHTIKSILVAKGVSKNKVARWLISMRKYEEAADLLEDLINEKPDNLEVLAEYVSCVSHFDSLKAEEYAALLPQSIEDEKLASSLNSVDMLEEIMPPRDKSSSMSYAADVSDVVFAKKKQKALKRLKYRAKKRDEYLKQKYPDGKLPKLDEDRWIPKALRRRRGKYRPKGTGGNTSAQGAANISEREMQRLDKSKEAVKMSAGPSSAHVAVTSAGNIGKKKKKKGKN